MSYLHVVSAQPGLGLEGIAAFPTDLSMLGQVPAPKVSPGQFGLAMSRVAIPDAAIRLLLLSATFRQMAQVLDNSYLDHRHWIALQQKNPSLKLNNAFRVVGSGGGLNGRRILYVGVNPPGPMFIPGASIESPTGWDIIRLRFSLSDRDTIPWIEDIAHETAHAFARVTAPAPGKLTPVQRVRAAVLEECVARRREQRVVTEIRATTAGRTALAGHRLRPIRMCDCERDWIPSAQKRTYLEHFILGMDWELAARTLSSADVDRITSEVAAIPLGSSGKVPLSPMAVEILRGTATVGSFAARFPVLKSPAGQAALVLRIVDASWNQLIATVGEGSPAWTGGAHLGRLERHARLFFKIPIGYLPCTP